MLPWIIGGVLVAGYAAYKALDDDNDVTSKNDLVYDWEADMERQYYRECEAQMQILEEQLEECKENIADLIQHNYACSVRFYNTTEGVCCDLKDKLNVEIKSLEKDLKNYKELLETLRNLDV